MGVKRAVDLARSHAEQVLENIYTLGPLIHNPQTLEELNNLGVKILDEKNLPQNLSGFTVIIRAHGISPQAEAELRKRGAKIIDVTCPRVKTNQLKAAALAESGYYLFIAGEETHAEIIGIKGYVAKEKRKKKKEKREEEERKEKLEEKKEKREVGKEKREEGRGKREEGEEKKEGEGSDKWEIVGNGEQAAKAAIEFHKINPSQKTALIGQTTISTEEYNTIGKKIAHFFPDVEIVPSICSATFERQEGLKKLLGKVDAVIVAGGKESANTRRLFMIAKESGKPCALVESAKDIPPDFAKYKTIGLTAGASTPDFVINEIERALF